MGSSPASLSREKPFSLGYASIGIAAMGSRHPAPSLVWDPSVRNPTFPLQEKSRISGYY